MKKLFLSVFMLWGIFTLTGCYNRYTGNFEQFPDINNLPSGVVDQSGLTDEVIKNLLLTWKLTDNHWTKLWL